MMNWAGMSPISALPGLNRSIETPAGGGGALPLWLSGKAALRRFDREVVY
jgi:hypothetical protein